FHPSEVERNGEQVLTAIQTALALPPSAWPQVPRDRKPEPESTGLVELLQAVLKARASAEGIAPSLIATTAEGQALVDNRHRPVSLDVPLLRGWRRQLIGELFLQVLDGQKVVRVDPKTSSLLIEPRLASAADAP